MKKSESSQQTKLQVLHTAERCFAANGIQKTSLNFVARESGVAPSLLLYHFKDLDDIFMQVILRVVGDGQKRAEEYTRPQLSPREQLRAYTDAMFDWIGQNSTYQILMLQFYHQAVFKEQFKNLNRKIAAGGAERISKILEQGKGDRYFASSQLTLRARAIQDLITGFVIRMATNPLDESPSKLREELFLSCWWIATREE